MATKEVSLRLTPRGEEAVKKALRDIGEDGKKMADKLDKGGKKSTRALKALDGAGKEASKSVDNLADRAGFAAGPLKAMGAGGIAAAAGIGALVLGLGAAIRIGKEAADAFADTGNAAEALGLSAETFQAVAAEAEAMGVSAGVLETGMKSLMERQSQLSLGTGELYSRLKDTNQELLRQLEALDNNEDRLRAVTDAMRDAGSETDRNRIAYAAFGEAGANLSRVLLNVDGGIDGLIEKGKALGLVISNDLIARGQELSTNMAIAAEVMDLQLRQAFIDFAPVALDGIKLLGDLASAASDFASNMRDATDNTNEFNAKRLGVVEGQLRRAGVQASRINDSRQGGAPLSTDDISNFESTKYAKGGPRLNALNNRLDEFNDLVRVSVDRAGEAALRDYRLTLSGLSAEALEVELERLNGDIDASLTKAKSERDAALEGAGLSGSLAAGISDAAGGLLAASSRGALGGLGGQRDVVSGLLDEARAREAGADAMAAQRAETERLAKAEGLATKTASEKLALQRQAAAIALELGDATLALALKEAELNKVRDGGLITQAQVDAVLQTYREKLDGTTEAAKRWLSVIEGAQTPVENIQQTIKDLNADLASGKFGDSAAGAAAYSEALWALTEALDAATKAEREGTDVYKAAEHVREGLKKSREAALSDSELLAREESRLNDLVTQGALSRKDATDALDQYSKKLREARGEVGLLGRAETILDGIESGRIRTVDDLKAAILSMIVSVIRQAAMAQAQSGSGGGFGGFLQGILGSVLGTSAGSTPAANPSGTPPIFGAGTLQQAHSGTVIGNSPRQVRRLGMGLGRDERLIVGRVGEEIVTAGDRKAIIEFIRETSAQNLQPGAMMGGPLPLDINLNVHTTGGGEADVEAAPSAGGGLDIDVFIRDKVRSEASSGGLDGALESRGFVKRNLK